MYNVIVVVGYFMRSWVIFWMNNDNADHLLCVVIKVVVFVEYLIACDF